jgi:hypothetical protein
MAPSAQPTAPGLSSSTLGQTLRRRRNQSWLSWPARGLPVQVFVAGLPAGGRAACSSALTSLRWLPGPGCQARPAGTRQSCCGCTPHSCQSTFPGMLGSGCESCKEDPFGIGEAVNQTRNPAAQACPRQPARACLTDTPYSRQADPRKSLKHASLTTYKPPPVSLHEPSPHSFSLPRGTRNRA